MVRIFFIENFKRFFFSVDDIWIYIKKSIQGLY